MTLYIGSIMANGSVEGIMANEQRIKEYEINLLDYWYDHHIEKETFTNG